VTTKPVNRVPEVDYDPDTEERDDAIIGEALKWSALALALFIIVIGSAIYFAIPEQAVEAVQETELAKVEVRETPTVEPPHATFTDVTRSAGITFLHQNAAMGRKLMPETMGGGCAFLDFDADGDQDLLLVNGLSRWPRDKAGDSKSEATPALYRNDGAGNFDDVTADSGLDVSMYGMGVGVGDYDNDGDLDLFVTNYLQWSREYDEAQNFQLTGGGRAYGRPQNFEGTFPFLYRNEGDGTFTDVAEQAGMHVRNPATNVPMAKMLGVVFVDVDRDGYMDVIVANDTVQNFLFHNRRDGSFEEIGAAAGIAFDMNGMARGAMGIDVERFRDNDALGVAIGNFSNEMTALYVSYGNDVLFMDEAIATGLGPNTRLELTFGVFYIDYDLDGRLDLFAANGHLEEEINRVQPSQYYEQPPQLFWNCGSQQDTEFLPVEREYCGDDLLKPMVGRGASFADIDGDGDLDILIAAVGGAPRLLRNDQQLGRHWLRFQLQGTRCNRDGIGATVEVVLPERTLWRRISPTRSYISQVELPVTFGLGNADRVERVVVHWPDGSLQEIQVDQLDRTYVVEQSEAEVASTE